MPKTLQIRDLDEKSLSTLKARAALERMSLSAYVARELAQLASTPTNAEVLALARDLARTSAGGASDEDILDVIRRGRGE